MPRDDAKSQMLKAQMGSFKSGKAGGRGRGGKPSARGGRGGGGGKTAVRERRDTEFLGTLNPFEIGAEYWVSDPKIVWKLTKCTAFEDWKVSVQHPEGHTQTIDLRYEYVWSTPLRPPASTPRARAPSACSACPATSPSPCPWANVTFAHVPPRPCAPPRHPPAATASRRTPAVWTT